MSIGYLDIHDELLTSGIAGVSGQFQRCQVEFVLACQLPNGGFPGRHGGADPYYTDFALRTLALFAPEEAAVRRMGGYLAALAPPTDVITCFNLLHIRRLLHKCHYPITLEASPIVRCLEANLAARGGFARLRGGACSAYGTFLAAMCYEMLDSRMPSATGAVEALLALRRKDGGFCDLPDGLAGQTSATAAALAFLLMRNDLTDTVADAAIGFLLKMQSSDGGLRAHLSAPSSDLLSTFTGSMTLSTLDALSRADLAALARFVRQQARGAGGFRGGALDDEPDLEFTYYGIATLALLRGHIASRRDCPRA